MNYIPTQIERQLILASAKKGVATLLLVLFTFGQPALAQALPTDILEDALSVQTMEITEPAEPLTVQEVLLHVCETNGYGEECAKTLLGMLWTESSNRSSVIGDNGRARGYFQIHYKMHKISIACAEDLVCSAQWTINYLKSNSYPKYVNYAVQCHNSCNVNNGYVAKVQRYGRNFWNKPLAIKQATPIEIALK